MGSNPIWSSDSFTEFPFNANIYHVVFVNVPNETQNVFSSCTVFQAMAKKCTKMDRHKKSLFPHLFVVVVCGFIKCHMTFVC